METEIKTEKSTARRNDILDAAKKLVYTKGYDQMTIQDLLDELNISKGAFYYYFSSKQMLLDALIDRLMEEAQQILMPIVEDPDLPAFEKFDRFFSTIARWKIAQKPFFLALLRMWYADENALFRQKSQARSIQQITPLFNSIIQQGLQEGVLSSPYPDQLGEVVLTLFQGMGDNISNQLLSVGGSDASLDKLVKTVAMYTHAIERILGAPPGSLHFIERDNLAMWITNPEEQL